MAEPALRAAEPLATLPPSNVIQADAGAIMDVIARAAADPSTNVDNLERLLGLYERITDRGAKAAYAAAMALMQPKLPSITRNGRILVTDKNDRSKVLQDTPYALWEDVVDAIRPHLTEHGFALSFKPGVAQDGKITVTGVLAHIGGHQEEATITLPHDSSGSKNAVQAVGSSLSYGKRYATISLLNITSRGEDDDGEMAGAKDLGAAAEAQVRKINACNTGDELARWHKDNRDAVTRLPKAEGTRVVALWRQRTTNLAEARS